MPARVQMSRQRPWRAEHPCAVVVARPTKWGNPFRVVDRTIYLRDQELWTGLPSHDAAIAHAVRAYRWQIENHPNVIGYDVATIRAELAGRDLACWCPLADAAGHRVPCHADVLLAIANPDAAS